MWTCRWTYLYIQMCPDIHQRGQWYLGLGINLDFVVIVRIWFKGFSNPNYNEDGPVHTN